MPRLSTTCLGGIDQSVDEADLTTCADARNVWAPDGRVEKRPGIRGIGGFFYPAVSTGTVLANGVMIRENPIGTFAVGVTLNSLPVGSRFYIGFSNDVVGTSTYPYSLDANGAFGNSNSNEMRGFVEYWNGSEWRELETFYRTPNTEYVSDILLQSSGFTSGFRFVWPTDIATTSIAVAGGTDKYYFRVTLVAHNGSTTFDASTDMPSFDSVEDGSARNGGVIGCLIAGAQHYFQLAVTENTGDTAKGANWNGWLSTDLKTPHHAGEVFSFDQGDKIPVTLKAPLNYTQIPLTDELFFIWNSQIQYVDLQLYRERVDLLTTTIPEVETRDFAIGTNAPFSRNFIAQRASFPAADYIRFFNSRFWMAKSNRIMWGAALPYHKVLPLLSEEPVGNASSDITGLYDLGEHLVVFKADSIWIMVLETIDATFGLSVFRPVQKVADVGCVSNGSIRKIGNELIFLSPKGLMAFNGQTIRRISDKDGHDRLVSFFAGIPQGQLQQIVAAHWMTNQVYMLAVPLDGSDQNNRVLVWDYIADTFWIWEGFEVQTWLEAINGQIYFEDSRGRAYELGNGNTDHGATIDAYVVTQKFGFTDDVKRKATAKVYVMGENLNDEVGVSVLHDDQVTALTGASGTLDFSDYNEAQYDVAVYDTSSYVEPSRRERKMGLRAPGRFFNVKLTHSVKNGAFAFSKICIDLVPVGT